MQLVQFWLILPDKFSLPPLTFVQEVPHGNTFQILQYSTENKGDALDEYKILKGLDKDMANELFNLIYNK